MQDQTPEEKKDENQSEDQDQINLYRQSYRWMGVGIEFAIVIGFFCWLGSLLDKIDDTFPGFMILGFFVGFAFMLYTLIKRSKDSK